MAKKSRQQLDLEAREESRTGANKRKFSDKDLNTIYPKTQAQEDLFHAWAEDKSMLAVGPPGTGKTFLSVFLALRDVLDPSTPYHKLIIVRSAVPVREQGFVPGSQEEKESVYEAPYYSICDALFPYSKTYENLKKNSYLQFKTTSFCRGETWDNAVIICDEIQNFSFEEAHTIMTRVGENSKIVFCGDKSQTDLGKRKNDKSGYDEFTKILDNMDSIEKVVFTSHDIVRSGLVKEYMLTKEDLGL